MIRGSASILADDKCPGNCRINSPDFVNFTKYFEAAVEEVLVFYSIYLSSWNLF